MGSITDKAILKIGKLTYTEKNWEALGSLGDLKVFPGDKEVSDPKQLFQENLQSGAYDHVVALYRSNDSTSLTGPFDAELIRSLPSSLKYICHNGAGYDNIDITACTSRGIEVSSTPVAVNNATADMTIWLMIGALRSIHVPYAAVREGKWRGPHFMPGTDPEDKVLGMIGMGGIGQAVAHRARAFGMKIQYYNRSRLSPELEKDAKYVGLDELIGSSDVVSLHCSLTAETTGLIGKTELGQMKKGAVLINTARGKLIDEGALIEALKDGTLRAAGLDVFENEPELRSDLVDLPNVVLTPHIGTGTTDTQAKMELLVLDNIKSALESGKLITQVREQLSKPKL
ncbi:D-isomer specific 2-hydroxyacid dehydrogenase [Calycina marina]|uniref:D-isomer specific 2-hydroxyacid dehydrogenase n=1 Tax=Calycina marina TaxID=1763456 RepID=A0A9P7Z521_9HELO|nr:D-isomer specific 2-hydroxyacid dehydrogenase [Calycina marina]